MVQLPSRCPFCGDVIEVSAFVCTGCDAVVEGRFSPHPLGVLDAEQTRFVLTFIRNRGNIKDVERELGLSYPAVRARIAEVMKALGFAGDAAAEESLGAQRADVLAALERGEINAAQAAERLKQL
mgnify:CR=1 FL=1